jgi:hypothetical protein
MFIALLLTVSSLPAEPVALPDGTMLRDVNFERHIAPLLGRHGCNTGACHGSFQGKGGLTLSLFGYSAEKDYAALTRDGMGRRVNIGDPEQSLLLLKPTAQLPHEGGLRFAKGSWQYKLLREWIAQGAKWATGDGSVKQIEVLPREHRFEKPGEAVQLKVVVEFGDGSREDMTAFCEFRVKDDYVAEVSPTGEVRGLRPGDTAVVIAYRGNLLTSRVYVPAAVSPSFVYPKVSQANFIDREVFAKLRLLNIIPSELSNDAEFLRRVTVDTIGTLPTPDEVRSFLADPSPDKRARKIDALLAHPMHAALWATKLCDITAANVDVMEEQGELGAKRAKMWHDWFRKRIAENMPYDKIARGVLTATSRDGKDIVPWVEQEAALYETLNKSYQTNYADRPVLDLFWRRLSNNDFFPLEQMAELTATAFLGVRLECAQCHKHPYDRWTQADYRAYANVFAQTRFGASPEVNALVARLLEERRRRPAEKAGSAIPHVQEVFVSHEPMRRLPRPGTMEPLPPKALGGPQLDYDGDARVKLAEWLTRPDNAFFARAFVNRVWAHYFGTGLVHPVDNFSVANPPSNEKLLNALAADFVEHGYDIRRLERLVLNSRTYQLSATPNTGNAEDRGNFSHARVRRVMAEVVVDVLNDALGVREDFGGGIPRGARAVEIAPNRVQNGHLTTIFRIFGRPARTLTCDCERSQEPAVPQTLFLMSDPTLLAKMEKGRLQSLLDAQKPDETIIEELFLATLSRVPNESEKSAAREHLLTTGHRKKAFVDMLWALINTREFIVNH